MKKLNRLLTIIAGSSLLVSCADEFNSDFKVDKPESIAQYEYLNAYGNLKSYVNRTNDPNFKLGAALAVDDYLKKELVYSLTCANFDEMTAGNEMKHASCVNDKGQMDFAKVTKFVETAKAAGLTVYGHTLCWHAQQNNTYLNGLIAPTVIPGNGGPTWDVVTSADFETDDASNYEYNSNAVVSFTAAGEGKDGKGRALKINNAEVRPNEWDCQFFVKFSPPMVAGEKYTLTMDVRSDADATFATQAHTVPYSYLYWDFFGSISSTSQWSTFTKEITITESQAKAGTIAFNLGKNATNYYFDNISLKKYNEEGGGGPTWDLVSGANFETDDASNYSYNSNAIVSFSSAGEGANAQGRALKIKNEVVRANEWDCQFFLTFAPAMVEGEQYELSMDVRADNDASFATQAHVVPYQYKHWDFFGSINATTTWSKFTKVITVSADVATTGAVAFNLGKNATTYYFDNITLKKYNPEGGGDQIIEKTDEEKKTILTGALETWIKGMMEACKGNVKSWDVVNEPMSDGNPYELKSDPSHTDTKNFYWQDYLGKEYARYAIKFARQYGGNDLKLFINDYNLEAAYNNNTKCDGLIKMIQYWESDGVTKIDGIGSQMHVTYNLNPEEQAKQEAAVVKMLQMLAASGKLIKISELDMGLFDNANNVNIKTADATYEQLVLMSNFYKFIIDKYFEIIPASQRYGITQWCITDSPEKSGWREGEPVGLWTLDYNRKPCYEGFVNGLK